MTKEPSFTPSAEWATKWKDNLFKDEFFLTRVRLTAIYTGISAAILGIFSYLLYKTLLTQVIESVREAIPDPRIGLMVFDSAKAALLNRILLIDAIILTMVVIVGFFLTNLTLQPIRKMLKRERRFIADASHELRTPLSVMKTALEVALRKKEGSHFDPRKILETTLSEVNTLTTLSNNLLTLSKESAAEAEFSNISVANILEHTVERVRNVAKEKDILLILSNLGDEKEKSDLIVLGNDTLLSQAFYNIIHNALHYTPVHGKVEVSCEKRGTLCEIKISDTGIGISKDHLEHIFEPFYRAENARHTEGTGLGLAIVKAHIEAHKGTIKFASIMGEGTTVTIDLPLAS